MISRKIVFYFNRNKPKNAIILSIVRFFKEVNAQ